MADSIGLILDEKSKRIMDKLSKLVCLLKPGAVLKWWIAVIYAQVTSSSGRDNSTQRILRLDQAISTWLNQQKERSLPTNLTLLKAIRASFRLKVTSHGGAQWLPTTFNADIDTIGHSVESDCRTLRTTCWSLKLINLGQLKNDTCLLGPTSRRPAEGSALRRELHCLRTKKGWTLSGSA